MNYSHNYIHDLADSTIISDQYIIDDIRNCLTRAGKPYLSATLNDASGTVPVVVWDYSGSLTPANNGDVVSVSGRVVRYRDLPQIQAEQLAQVAPEQISDEMRSALVPVAPINYSECASFICSMAESIQNPQLRALCDHLLDEHWELYTVIPAAKSVHHAFRSGLMMHTADMLVLANTITAHCTAEINRDLLVCGILLHDIGKLFEFELSPITGLVKGYTPAGSLVGHSVLGVIEIAKAADALGLDPQLSLLVQHMILSHHGAPSSGAAKVPMIPEAELLHDLDLLDSRQQIYLTSLKNVSPGSYSQYIPALDRILFQHGLNAQSSTAAQTLSSGCSPADYVETDTTILDLVDEDGTTENADAIYLGQLSLHSSDNGLPLRATVTYRDGSQVTGIFTGGRFYPDDSEPMEF